MKPTCGWIRDWLGAYADNELDPARADQVRRHVETCAGCRRELTQIHELHRLAKRVEHPRLAEDYWDWQRIRVWRGIRDRKRAPTPWYRPSFVWPKLATAAAGLVVVLVVVVAGWRTFLPKPGPVGVAASERKTALQAPVAAAPAVSGAKSEAATRAAAEPVADMARARAEGRADELGEVAASRRDAEKTDGGYAGKGVGAAGATWANRPEPATGRGTVPETEVAAEEAGKKLSTVPPSDRQHVSASLKRENRIVSGPVLLESPPLPDADALDTGTVLLSVKTDSVGRVLSAAVRRSSGSAKLDSVAVRQIRQSRFQAAVKKNRSVPSTFEYPFRFQKKQAEPQEQQKQQDKDHTLDKDDQQNKQDDQKQEPKLKEKTKK